MSTEPMYVLMLKEDYENDDLITGPSEYELYDKADFTARFGNEAGIQSRNINKEKEDRIKAAKDFVHLIGNDICYVDDDAVKFRENAKEIFAQRKLKELKKAVDGMTSDEFLRLGEWKIRNILRNMFWHVHPYGENCQGEYPQAPEDFIINHMENGESYIVSEIIYVHY